MSMISMLYSVSPLEAERLRSEPESFDELTRYDNPSSVNVSLEKAWHGLHFLLAGTAWEGAPPLDFIVSGGKPLEDSDQGYGPARLLGPAEVREIHSALAEIGDGDLWARFDPDRMTAEEIYPLIWDEPPDDLRDEYLMYFRQLKAFVAEAERQGHSVVVTLG
jgi:Domain of unknown function (DUF1877)